MTETTPTAAELDELEKALRAGDQGWQTFGGSWTNMDEAADALAALRKQLDEAREENERLRLAMMGGEDAPGYAASVPLDDLIASFARHERDLRIYYDRIDLANAQMAAALRELREMVEVNCMCASACVCGAVRRHIDAALAQPAPASQEAPDTEARFQAALREQEQMFREELASQEAPASPAADMVLVPREPTMGMLRALMESWGEEGKMVTARWALGHFREDYQAMIAAAPASPSPGRGEYVLCYPGVPDAWRVKPEDMPAPASPSPGLRAAVIEDDATVEKVARAVYESDGGHSHGWVCLSPFTQAKYQRFGRAAIRALASHREGN